MLRVACACIVFMLTLASGAGSARADCTNPARTAGAAIYNSTIKVFQYCDGTNWKPMNAVGSGSGGCAPYAEGKVLFNTDYRVLQGCAGNVWRPMGPLATAQPTISGLLAHWTFDESSGTTAADSSGNGLNGTLTGGGTWQPTGGVYGGALLFNGSSSTVEIPDPGTGSILDFSSGSSITITAWINQSNVGGCCQGLVRKGDNFYFIVEGSTPLFGLVNGSYQEVYGSTALTNGQWRFVAITTTFGGGPLNMYVNGVAETISYAGDPVTLAPTPNNDNLSIGEGYGYFAGLMDDVRIYNRALTAPEIALLYTGGGSSGCTSPTSAAGAVIYNSANKVVQYCNGSSWVGVGAPAGCVHGTYMTTTPGLSTWSVPAGCTSATIEAWGAGGGGGYGNGTAGNRRAGGGGGGSGVQRATTMLVAAGGGGGAGGAGAGTNNGGGGGSYVIANSVPTVGGETLNLYVGGGGLSACTATNGNGGGYNGSNGAAGSTPAVVTNPPGVGGGGGNSGNNNGGTSTYGGGGGNVGAGTAGGTTYGGDGGSGTVGYAGEGFGGTFTAGADGFSGGGGAGASGGSYSAGSGGLGNVTCGSVVNGGDGRVRITY